MNTIIVAFKDETMIDQRGVLVNSHWSEAFGCWMCLLACEDGQLRTIRSDALGVSAEWIPNEVGYIMLRNDDDENNEGDEDNV